MAYIKLLPHPPPVCDPDFLSSPVSPTFLCLVFHVLGGKGNCWQFLVEIMLLPPPVCLPKLCPLPQMSELLNEPCYLFFILDILLKTRLIIPHLCSLYPPLSLHLSSLIVTTCYVSIFSHHLPRNVGSRNVGTGLSHIYPLQ